MALPINIENLLDKQKMEYSWFEFERLNFRSHTPYSSQKETRKFTK